MLSDPYPPLQGSYDAALSARVRVVVRALMQRARAWRVEQALPRRELARLSGMSESTLKHAELRGQLSLERFVALAVVLGADGDFDRIFARRHVQAPGVVRASRARHRRRGRHATRLRALRHAVPLELQQHHGGDDQHAAEHGGQRQRLREHEHAE